MTTLVAVVIPTRERPPANGVAREDPVDLIDITLHRHVAANHRLGLLLAEARGGDEDAAGAAGAGVADAIAAVAAAGEEAVAQLAAG